MKMRPSIKINSIPAKRSLLTLGLALTASLSAFASEALVYDSQFTDKTASTQNYLSLISSDSELIAKPATTTSTGWNTTFIKYNTYGKSATVKYGSGHDAQWRFGSDAQALSGTPKEALLTGEWIGFSFSAAQDLVIDGFSFNLYVNSVDRNNYAARDAGLFISIDGGDFTQFGSTHDNGSSSNGKTQHGTVTFHGAFKVFKGQNVKFRLAFTDRTGTTGGPQQKATRLGSFVVSAKSDHYASIPEPSSYALLSGILALTCTAARRRKL